MTPRATGATLTLAIRRLLEEGANLADIRRRQEQGGEHRLGRHAVKSTASRVIEGFVGRVLDVTVEALIGVAQAGVCGVPLGTAMKEFLAELGSTLRWNRHALLGA